jgi:hypothetical protein
MLVIKNQAKEKKKMYFSIAVMEVEVVTDMGLLSVCGATTRFLPLLSRFRLSGLSSSRHRQP